jgi:hypothetical protein
MAKYFVKKSKQIVSNLQVLHKSVFILYFIFLLSLANLFYLVTAHNYIFASIFILVGFITAFFSKNMIVILCIALVVTNVLQFGKRAGVEEGFEDDSEEVVKKETVVKTETKADKDKLVENRLPEEEPVENNTSVADIEEKYVKLFELQDKIKQGMQNIKEPLSEAENIVAQLAKTLGQPQLK